MVRRGTHKKTAAPKQTPEVQPASDEDSYESKEESQQTKRQRPDDVEPELSDVESVSSEVEGPSKRSQSKKTGVDATRINIDPEVEDHLAEWIRANPLFYDKTDRDFKDTAKKNRLMEDKAKEFGLTGTLVQLWFRNMRTVFTRQVNARSKKSGSSVVKLTARQQWTVQNVAFLKDHILAKSTCSTLGQVLVPDEEVESDGDDGSSISESTVSSVQNVVAQSIQPPALASTSKKGKGKRNALEDQLSTFMTNIAASSKSTLEAINQQQSKEQSSLNVRQLFCKYLSAEIDLLTDDQFYSFHAESMAMLSRFRQSRQTPAFQQIPVQPSRPPSVPQASWTQQQWQHVQSQPLIHQYPSQTVGPSSSFAGTSSPELPLMTFSSGVHPFSAPGVIGFASAAQQSSPNRSESVTGELLTAAANVLEDPLSQANTS